MIRTARGLTALAVLCGVVAFSAPASAQLMDKIGKGKKLMDKADDLVFTEAEEIELGTKVSEQIRQRFGVVQDPAVHKYVTLVGAVLVTNSTRPNLPWTFIVLDTDAVNAFAAPGGFVHVTKGALALIANESELAGVLGHELIHVTEKHTIAYLKKNAATNLAVDATGKGDSKITDAVVSNMKNVVLQGFGRKEELESDQKGLALANKAGYAPQGLGSVLQKILDRNKDSTAKRGLFASHPEMQERIKKLGEMIEKDKLASTATLDARYKKFISYKPVPISQIATVQEGSSGLAGGSNGGTAKKDDAKKEGTTAAKKDDEPADPPKKKGFGLSKMSNFGGGDKKQAQVTGSGAGRGLDPEVDAKGGGNPALVAVKVTRADVDAFKKEGKLS
jgi:predicted Zn-dependent protease